MSKKILVIAVHPDDETLGCGGTLLKHNAAGDQVFWLIITKANQRITAIKDIAELQKEYCNIVAKEYDFSGLKQLDFLTTELDKYSTGEIVSSISSYINEVKPVVIYLNHYSDIHSDHTITFNAVMACTKNFRYPFIQKILLFETLSETEFAPAIGANTFKPNVFNDITPFMEKKLHIMKLFTTEQMEEPYPRAISSIRALGRFRGSRIGVQYAEAFQLLFEQN